MTETYNICNGIYTKEHQQRFIRLLSNSIRARKRMGERGQIRGVRPVVINDPSLGEI